MFVQAIKLVFLFSFFSMLITSCGGGDSPGAENTKTITIKESTLSEWSAGNNTSLFLSEDLMLDVNPATVRNFTTCGASGSTGPSQGDCDLEYTGTNLDATVTVTGNGIQQWTVPQSGAYLITVGGSGHNADGNFIQGAVIRGVLQLTEGDELHILVGQQGGSPRGGNGGSFVTTSDNTPLLIAGGAGGMRNFVDIHTRGSTSTAGNNAVCGKNAIGGANGDGGAAINGGDCSGAGAGLLGDGAECGGGFAFVNGGLGGNSGGAYEGGFGGGGGVNSQSSPGGGGGYSGGAVYYTGTGYSCAGGGGSFISATASKVATSDGSYDDSILFNGTNIISLDQWRTGDGLVKIGPEIYSLTGSRISPVFDIATSDPAQTYVSSTISWNSTEASGTSILVEVRGSLDGGVTWTQWNSVENHSEVPVFTAGVAMGQARLQTRITLMTSDQTLTPVLHEISTSVTHTAP